MNKINKDMKRIFSALLAVATLFAGCTKSDVDETGLDGKIQLKLTSSIAPTRATDIAFEDGDLVGLYITKGDQTLNANEKMTAYASGVLEAATPLYYPEDGAPIDLFAYYPYVENPTVPAVWTIPAAQDEIELTDYDLCSGAVAGVRPSTKAVPVIFNHLMSKVTVDLTVSGAGVTDEQKEAVKVKLLAAVSATVNAQTGEVTEVADPVEITLAENNTALVVPQNIAKDTKIAVIETANGPLDVMIGKDVTFEAGKNNILKLSLTINEYMSVNVTCTIADWNTGSNIELNKPEIGSTGDLSKDGLANCYIVSKAGKYTFAAKQLNGNVLSGAKADWVWMSDATLISNVEYADDVITFSASGDEGNGLIALLDADGNIVWSWHIWCTDAPAEQKWNENAWLDRNVGATSATADDVTSYGLLYQWGRKDPFIGANTIGAVEPSPAETTPFQADLTMPTVVNEAVVGEGNGWANILGQSTMEKATMYPMCLYTYKEAGEANPAGAYGGETIGGLTYNAETAPAAADWCEGGASDRWYNTSVTASGKTLNDPCPAGYMIPTQEQQYADFLGTTDGKKWFNAENKSAVTNGITYNYGGGSVWVPATGVRFAGYSSNGLNKFIGNTAMYWNSTETNPGVATFVSVAGTDVVNTGGATMYKSFACPVRCVAEAGVETPDLAIDLSADGTANSYIVSAPGTYKFRATVMGNGKATTGITPTKLNPASARLSWAVMASNNYGGSASKYGTDAATNMNNVIVRSSIKIKRGYIYFETPEKLSPANAVIDALDAEGNIIWSWHIWVAPNFDAEASAKAINTTAVKDVVMMDRNLGAYGNGEAGADDDIAAARGLVYQWGRKDPFFVWNVGNYGYCDWWDYENDKRAEWQGDKIPTAESTTLFTDDVYDVNKVIDYTVKHPSTFITGVASNGYSWIFGTNKIMSFDKESGTPNWGHLWGNTETGKADCIKLNAGSKSIYDPCPVGWRVPEAGAFKFFTYNGESGYPAWRYNQLWKYNCLEAVTNPEGQTVKIEMTNGAHFYYAGEKSETELVPENNATIYFPGIFARVYSGGVKSSPINIELMTNHACRNVDNDNNLYKNGRMYFKDNGWSWYDDPGSWYDQQACAMPVRCIKE